MFHDNSFKSQNPHSNDNPIPAEDHNSTDREGDRIQSSADDPYTNRQAKRDREYQQDYSDWISSLSAEQLKELKVAGVDKHQISYRAKGGPTIDLADSPAASYEPDIAAIIDAKHETGINNPTERNAYEVLRHFIAELMAHGNAPLMLDCLALILDLNIYEGESMADIGKRYGIGSKAVSRRCNELCEEFDLPQSRAMYRKKPRNRGQDSKHPELQ
jgi:hypothetical protein